MIRNSFLEILKCAKIDLRREYNRLYHLFYKAKDNLGQTLENECAQKFLEMSFRGTCLSLDDFNDYYGFSFEESPGDFDLEYLIRFCEYTYNLVVYKVGSYNDAFSRFYIDQMSRVIELINYKFIDNKEENISILIPKNKEVMAVVEIIDKQIAFSVLQYNHYDLCGDLKKKKTILKFLADDIEPQRKQLKQINNSLETQLFQLFNNFIRHNNDDNIYIKSLSNDEIESCYDDIYQMWLLAKLEIDNLERKKRVGKILEGINTRD